MTEKPGYKERIISKYAQMRYPVNKPVVKQVTINGYTMMVLINEEVGRRIALLHSYEPFDTQLMRQIIRPQDICIDVGANTGYYTFLMAQCAKLGQVHAFEPVPLNYNLLETGRWLNGFSNIYLNQLAVGSIEGELDFSVAADGAYSSLRDTGRKSELLSVKARVSTLDKYVHEKQRQRIDILKVDVEGAESEVINGGMGVLTDELLQPRVIMIELCSSTLRVFASSIQDVVNKMQLIGYEPFVTDFGKIRHFVSSDYDNIYNVFFSKDRNNLVG